MAVTEAKVAQTIGGEATGTSPGSLSGGYTARYLVKCSSSTDGPVTILQYFQTTPTISGFLTPWFGRPYVFFSSSDYTAFCKTISPTYITASEGWWEVEVRWESLNGSQNEQDQNPNNNAKNTTDPLDWHDDVEVQYTQISVPVYLATFRGFSPKTFNPFLSAGKLGPVVNSAFVPYDPPPEMELDVKVVRFSKNIKSWDGADGNAWQGVVNTEEVVINKPECLFTDTWGPLTARIKQFSGQFAITNGIKHWKRTIEVHVNPAGWRGFLVDRGLSRRAAPGDKDENGTVLSVSDMVDYKTKHIPLKDDDGYPLTEPVLFDGNGKPLEPGKPVVYMEWSYYEEKPYDGILW